MSVRVCKTDITHIFFVVVCGKGSEDMKKALCRVGVFILSLCVRACAFDG